MYRLTWAVLLASAVSPVFSAAVAPAQKVGKRDLQIIKTLDNQEIGLGEAIANSIAAEAFKNSKVVMAPDVEPIKRADPGPEPDPNGNVTIPENIYVLQCTEPLFRGDCIVFTTKLGQCVSYGDFGIDAPYNNNITSLSTSTGGLCFFNYFLGCGKFGVDPGVALNYTSDMSNPDANPQKMDISSYENAISSWHC